MVEIADVVPMGNSFSDAEKEFLAKLTEVCRQSKDIDNPAKTTMLVFMAVCIAKPDGCPKEEFVRAAKVYWDRVSSVEVNQKFSKGGSS